jgi:3-Oxoacyl-[acyl-carrier-protein (ACP)] synthase III
VSELLFNFSGEDVYISKSAYTLGAIQRTLNELQELQLLVSPVEWLQSAGYERNRCAADSTDLLTFTSDVFRKLLGECSRADALIVHHSYAENTSIVPPANSRELLARANYFPVNLLRHFEMDDVPYWGSYSSGCTGFMSLLTLAAGVLRGNGAKEVVCLTTDLKPRDATYDSMRERLLTSDAASGFVVGRERRGYQVIGVGQYSSSRSLIPLVEVVKRSVLMTRSLLEAAGVQPDGAQMLCHYPNMYLQAWQMVSHFLKVAPENQLMDEMAERAHCLSSDAIIPLEKVRGTPGRIHVIYSFGSGLHLAVAVLKEV